MQAQGSGGTPVFIAFRSVNCPGSVGYDPSLQRHHLLPRQLLAHRCFGRMFDSIGRHRVRFDDFSANGLLLPATEAATVRTGMPLHRGPHRRYTEVVIARVGRIEADWTQARRRNEMAALSEALLRLQLLQAALRRQLLAQQRRVVLNRNDPLGTGFDFTELDAMAETIWAAQEPVIQQPRRARSKQCNRNSPRAAPWPSGIPAQSGRPNLRPCRRS